jgi:Probable Zinc-ribbon domain
MPFRHPTEVHPDGDECQWCDKGFEHWEGPRTGYEFTFTVQEIAGVLLSVGRGTTLRETASQMRQGAYRPRTFTRKRRFMKGGYSREARTITAYLDAFAPVILDAKLPKVWPDVVAIDSLPLRKRRLVMGEIVSVNAGEIMAAVDHFVRPSRPILSRVCGGKDGESWIDFLSSLPGQPRWVVADRGSEIEYAVRRCWPDAILYRCDEHLRRNARDWALEDGIDKWRKTKDAPHDLVMVKEDANDSRAWPPPRRRYFELHPVWRAILMCLRSPADWASFKAVVEEEVPPQKTNLRRWIADNEDLVLHQCELRRHNPDRPSSTGQAEAFLGIVRAAFLGRAGRFTNAARLDKVLGLMVLNRAAQARRATYQGLLRSHFLAHEGKSGVTNWRIWLDTKGATSLDRLMLEADLRTAVRTVDDASAHRQERQEAAIAADADAQLAAGRPLRRGRKRRPDETPRGTYFSVKGKMVADTDVGAEWHPTANGDRDPRTVRASSHVEAMWLCREHESLGHLHEWSAPIVQRTTHHTGCPWHLNRRVCSGNSLRATHPEIVEEWHPTLNGDLTPDEVFSGSPDEVWWVCRTDATHPAFHQRVSSRTRQFAGCPECAKEERRAAGRAKDAARQRRTRDLAKQARKAGISPARSGDASSAGASEPTGEHLLRIRR